MPELACAKQQAEQSRIDQEAFRARMVALAKVACDKSNDDETRIAALMTFDSLIWERRTRPWRVRHPERTKTDITNADYERRRHDRKRVKLGTMAASEAPDSFGAALM